MKKILLIIILFIPFYVFADSAKFVSFVPKCSYVTNKKTIIPVEVISQNDGVVSSIIDSYILGSIYNENVNINFSNISDKGYNINVDSMTDKNGYSNINFVLKNKREYKALDKVINFDIEIIFDDDIPNKIYVLGTEILLSKDKELCNKLNNYDMSNINSNMMILNDNNYSYIMIIGILIIIIIFLWKRGNDNAIYKNKNKQVNRRK